MVIIRLARGGAKKRPFYHIVVTNSRNARDGRFIERLGFYNPIAAGEEIRIQLNKERIDYWISKGAQVSERADHLIKNFAEIAAGKEPARKKPKHKPKKEKKPEEKPAEEKPDVGATGESPAEEKPAEESKEEPPAEKEPKEKPAEEPPEEEKTE
jgi:small subunit ribosomal protein S16